MRLIKRLQDECLSDVGVDDHIDALVPWCPPRLGAKGVIELAAIVGLMPPRSERKTAIVRRSMGSSKTLSDIQKICAH